MKAHEQFEQLSSYLDGELNDAERASVEAHLPTCAQCRQTLDALRATIAEMHALPAPEPSAEASWAWRAAVARARSRPARMWRALGALGSAAAVLIGFVAFSSIGGQRDNGAALSAGPDDGRARGPSVELLAGDFGPDSADALLADPDVVVEQYDATSEAAPAAGLAEPQADAFTSGAAPTDDSVSTWIARFHRCEAEVLAEAQVPYLPTRYLVADYQGERALFLLYRVGDPAERVELWVMRPRDCFLRYFSQSDA